MKTTLIVLVLLACALGAWLWTPDLPRRDLEARYLRAPDDLIAVLGVRLHVRDTGPRTAPPVILLHGFGSNLQTWDGWAQALERDHRVIRLDLPGSGLSGPDPTGIYTDARTLDILQALMGRLGVARASIVGNSIGGRLAWTFAAEHPERVTRLVLVSPDGFASPGFTYGAPAEVPALFQVIRYVLPKALVRRNLAAGYGDATALSAATVDRYSDLLRAPGARAALIARMQQTVLTPPDPLLRRIRAPVLLVWGEKDRMIPFSNAADYRRRIPESRLAAFPTLGHVPQEEAPETSAAAVRAFLADPAP